jgi:hypothetical protein
VFFFDGLMDLLRKSLEKLENMHDYGAIVLVGGRCRADFGFELKFTELLVFGVW